MTERYYYNGCFINDRKERICFSSIEAADRLNQYERRINGAVRKITHLKEENRRLKEQLKELKE